MLSIGTKFGDLEVERRNGLYFVILPNLAPLEANYAKLV